MDINEDCIRRRAYRMWEVEGRPPGRYEDHWQRARQEIETELLRASEHMSNTDHRLPLHVEEALIVDVALYDCTRGG
ncbi:MAG: DUF2934 domain-containing protein [Rhodospirillaceae bacterium]|nr:DUF2934 domain-containing protein [Rhodospirillales bacterium]